MFENAGANTYLQNNLASSKSEAEKDVTFGNMHARMIRDD
jgi:hypothetical protein